MSEVTATAPNVLRDATTVVTATFFNDAGVSADPGATTVSVTNLAGTVVVASAAAGTPADATTRTVSLSGAATANLDTLTATWVTTNFGTLTTRHEIVGGFLFTVAEARAFGDGALAAPSYTSAMIEAARARITDEFESICGVSFVPRYSYEIFNGDGRGVLSLRRMHVTGVRSIDYRASGGDDWTAYTADELADIYAEPWGEVIRESLGYFTTGRRNIRVGFEHGYESVPHEIKIAGLHAIRYEMVNTDISSRAISISNEQGTTQVWMPNYSGRGAAVHPIPDVDRRLQRFMSKVPVIA